MPVLTFACGEHTYERRVPYGVREQECIIGKCSNLARARSVYRVNNTHPAYWGGELPRQAAEARDEYLVHASEFRKGLAEEQANGFAFAEGIGHD